MPSQFTIELQEGLRATLPFDDKRDFEEAKKGFIAAPPYKQIKAEAGHVAWDMASYEWLLQDKQHDSIHPSLQRQTLLNMAYGLHEVVPDKIYQVRGYDLANISFIKSDTGWIVLDPLTAKETAKAALEFINEKIEERPVVAVIYSHSHADHFGGVRGVVDEADVKSGKVKVIAPEGFTQASVDESILGGNLQSRRVAFQYGALIPRGPKGMMTTGLGLATAPGTTSFMVPTDTITKDGQTMKLAGLEVEFMLAQDTEAPSEMFCYIPKYKALCTAEDAVHNMHNVYSQRGAKLRSPLKWSKALKNALLRWGDVAEVLYAPHHWPIWGNDAVNSYLEKQALASKYINDQTLRLADHG